MLQNYWKKFDEAELTHSSVHHLLAINSLKNEQGYARLVDVSKHLNISRASVSITIGKLKSKGFVAEDHNKFLNLSQKGATVVDSVLERRKVVENFFSRILKLRETTSEINACKIEHLLDEEAAEKMSIFLRFYFSDNQDARDFRNAFERYLTNGASI